MKIKRVKLFSNDNLKSKEIEQKLKTELENNGILVCEENYDLAVVIGGDGSFLRMLKQNNFNSDIYYIGINTGTLGFLQEIKPDKINEFVQCIKNDSFVIDNIGIQKTKIQTHDGVSIFYSLNDIVIRDKNLNTTILNIMIDDVVLEKYAGDGILVSTSVGSTAYNMSYGGSIVYNTLHTLQITPIAPLNSKAYRNLLNGIIISENKMITIIPENEKRNLIVTIDGENNVYNDVYKIKTIISKKRIKCLRTNAYNFIDTVNEKFLKSL